MVIRLLLISTLLLLPWPTVEGKPSYTYECKENKSIRFMGLYAGSTVVIISNNSNCKNKSLTLVEGSVLIDPNCTTITQTDASVLLKIYDPHMYTSTTTQNPSTITPSVNIKSLNITGGRGTEKYRLTCKLIPSNGTIKTAIKHFEGQDNDVLQPVNINVNGIDIRFKSKPEWSSQDVSAVYVGDEFYMFIKYLGVSKYTVRPRKCTAYMGKSTESKTSAEIWKDNENCVLQGFDGTHMMENFVSTTENGIVYAKMYAFHFKDEQDITIKCDVLICATGDCSGASKCLTSTPKRKRRESLTKLDKQMSGHKSIRVYDSKLDTLESTNRADRQVHDLTPFLAATALALLKTIYP